MEMMRVVGLGLVAAALIVVVRQQRPEMGLMLSLVAGLLIFGLVLGRISDMLDIFQTLASKAEVNLLYLGLVIKILGITYLAEFGIQICKDAGENAIASKIEFAGKVFILVLAMPLLGGIFDFIVGLIP
ncbi:MAG: stage III sporulation protein AD [bacterium]